MKNYIKINLNKAESSEVVKERVLERTRWVVFGVLIFSLLFINVRVWMIGFGSVSYTHLTLPTKA